MARKFCAPLKLLRSPAMYAFILLQVCLMIGCSSSTNGPTPNPTTTPGEIGGVFHEYPLPPSKLTPGNIVAGADGNLWFTEVGNDQTGKIGRITLKGNVSEFPLPTTNAVAFDIVAGADGNLWFTEGTKIGRITTAGVISEFPLKSQMTAQRIAVGPDGNLWFTDQGKIGLITLKGQISEFSLPIHQYPAGSNPIKEPAGSGPNQPLAITAGPDGNLWFTELGPAGVGASIGRITTSGKITEFSLPSTNVLPSSITGGPDGNLWFTEIGSNNGPSKIGMITPQGQISEFTLSHYLLNGITNGPDGAVWFTEGQYNGSGNIVRITAAGEIKEFPLPKQDSIPGGITTGPDKALWFTASQSNGMAQIGQLV